MYAVYASIITKCILTKQLKLGKLVHSLLIKNGLILDTFLANRLIDFYSKCNSVICANQVFDELRIKNTYSWNSIISAYASRGHFDIALQLLDEMPEPNAVTYNSLIFGLSRYGLYSESLSLFKRMHNMDDRIWMDEFTMVSIVGTAACMGALELLYQVHGVALVIGLKFNIKVYNALINAYGKCKRPDICHIIFSQMQEHDVVSCTSMIVAYAQASRLSDAHQLFNQMPVKNTITWTSLIAAYAQNGQGSEALVLFKKMIENRISLSDVTYVAALSACADTAHFVFGKQIHGSIIRNDIMSYNHNTYIANALLDMYGKCGAIRSAITVFKKNKLKDVITWNSMITALSQNGYGQESLDLFNKMIRTSHVKPNHRTFLAVLSGCCHTGLVSEVLQILKVMEKDHNLVPKLDHYSILIDSLGKKNRLEDALELIVRAPRASDHVGMWGALFSACLIHENLDIARIAADALIKLEPENGGRYVTLSNAYASAGKWDAVNQIRIFMDHKELTKVSAHSWIQTQSINY